MATRKTSPLRLKTTTAFFDDGKGRGPDNDEEHEYNGDIDFDDGEDHDFNKENNHEEKEHDSDEEKDHDSDNGEGEGSDDHGRAKQSAAGSSRKARNGFANQRPRSDDPRSAHAARSKHAQHLSSRREEAVQLRGKPKSFVMRYC